MATRVEPLFVRFANGDASVSDVIDAMASSEDEVTRRAVEKARSSMPDLSVFKDDFRAMLSDLAENGISRRIVNYVDSYMKPSLEEFVSGADGTRSGEIRRVVVKSDDAPWIEAVLCYNLCLYLRVYGIQEFKQCPTCKKFFTNKGRYAKYCMEHTPKK